jgi:predicted dehydrogenase
MSSKTIRLGFVGAGKQAQCAHIRNYAALPDCTLAAIADPDEILAGKVAARYGIEQVYTSHQELIAKAKLDAIVVTLRAIPAAELVVCDFLAAKIPVFVEKPLAYSVAAAERVVAAAKTHGTLIVVGYHKRSDPATMFAKAEIDRLKKTGELGKLRYARVHVCLAGDWMSGGYLDAIKGSAPAPAPAPLPMDEFAGMDEKTLMRYASFAGAHSHQFDLMRHLIGEDYHFAYVQPSGILLVVESDSKIPGTFEFTPYASTKDWRESALVAFERGFVKVSLPAPVVNNLAGKVEVFRDEGGTAVPMSSIPVFPARSALQQQAANFLETVRNGGGVMCGPEDALKSLVIARDLAFHVS